MSIAGPQFATRPPPTLSTHGRTELAVAIFFLIFCTLTVLARFWSRYLKGSKYGWDDWFILAALPVYYSEMGLQLYAIFAGGLGWHVSQVTARQFENLSLQLTVVQFPYAILFLLVRLSICCLFLRIFVHQWFRYSVYGVILISSFWTVFVIVTAFTVCIPFELNWNPNLKGTCNNSAKKASYLANAIWTILIDAVLWALPQFCVWQLQMPWSRRAILSAVFALGIFDIVISIIRCIKVQDLNFEDFTYAVYPAQTWTVVEISVALIIACAPMCRQAIEYVLPLKLLARLRRGPRPRSPPTSQDTIGSPHKKQQQQRRASYNVLDEPADPRRSWLVSSAHAEARCATPHAGRPRPDEVEMNKISVQRETMITTDDDETRLGI